MNAPKYSFKFRSPSDLLAKAKRDLSRLKSSCSPIEGDDHPEDHGLNLAITIWHIADWTWKIYNPNNNKQLQGLGIQKFDEFHSLLRRESEALAICYEIATGSKHMKLEKDSNYVPRVEDTRVSLGPVTELSIQSKVLKVELADGKLRRADAIFSEAIAFWETFFAKHKIS